jgi:hypothetical protein
MTRRDWVWSLGVALCGGLLPGCIRTYEGGTPLAPPPLPVRDKGFAAGSRGSPYHSMPGRDGVAKAEPPAPAPQTSEPQPAPQPETPEGKPPVVTLGVPEDVVPEVPVAVGSEPITTAKPPDEPPLMGALRCFLDKRPEEALDRLKGYDKINQELLLGLLPLAARLAEGSLRQANPQDVAAVVDQLNSVLGPLRSRAPLTIKEMRFCRWIGGFGMYEPLPVEHRFRKGERVQIYVELQNFTSRERREPSGDVRHVIQLVSSAEILDETRKKAWPHEILFQRQGSDADESRTPRHDYFDNYGFWVPDLPPGLYTLVIQVEDRGTTPSRTVKGSLDFRVTNIPGHGS